ncbi:MAG: phage portal protein [Solirubrobacterales bacterium]
MPPVMLSALPGESSVTPSNALAIADAYACVRALSDAAASLPLVVYRRTEAGRIRAEGATAELIRRPAPATTTANLIGQLVAHLNLWGNAYLGLFRSEGKLTQIAALAPDRVTPELRRGEPVYTIRDERGRQSEHGTDDVVHIRALSTDGLLGLSPVRQARAALGLSADLIDHASTFFQNSARPSGIVKAPAGAGSREALEALRATWEAKHRGMANAHRIAVVSGEVDFIPLAMPLEDLQFIEQRRLSATETARIFRVPPWIIGAEDGGSLTYANLEQQNLAFATHSLRPWLVLIEQALSAHRDLFPGGLYCEFLLDALLRADSATRAETYAKALDPERGWMTRAEVRRLENLDPETETS